MKIFFVVDDKNKFDEKLEMLTNQFPTAELCIFLTEASSELKSKAKIKKHHIAVCSKGKLQAEMNKFIKSQETDDIFVLCSSVVISDDKIAEMKKELLDGSKMVFFKAKSSSPIKKFFSKVYNWFVKMIFFSRDTLASVKVQYISAEVVEKLKIIGFKFRIFNDYQVPYSIIEVDKQEDDSLKIVKKIRKNNYYNLIGLVGSILLFVLLTVFVKLPFLVGVLLCLFVLFFIFMQILFAVKNILDDRMDYDGAMPIEKPSKK